MTNAKLLIDDSNGFSNDIWQYDANFNREQWVEVLKSFTETMYEAKEYIEGIGEYLDDRRLLRDAQRTIDIEFMDNKVYALVDIINFFENVKVDMCDNRVM